MKMVTTMALENVNHDKDGNVVSYSGGKPGCAFGEVLQVRLDERMGRMESNLGDARIEVRSITSELKDVNKQVNQVNLKVTQVCGSTHELMNEVRTYVTNQKITNDENAARLKLVEKHVNFMQAIGRISIKSLTIGIPVLSFAFMVYKFIEGKQ